MKKILIVDDEPNNLQVLRQILRSHFQLYFTTDGQKALEAASRYLPDLILLDIMMPEMDGYEVCSRLKQQKETREIPVIFITAMCEYEDEARGFDVGAVDYIQKPISGPVVLRRIQTHLSLVRARSLEDSQRETIYMMGMAGHFNDNDTGQHIWRMAAYSGFLARAIGWDEDMAERIELAAPMHDTGKIGIPDSILKAARPLEPDEWEIMKTHAQIGHLILSRGHSPLFALAAEIALTHHEKWDGSGYPSGLSGEQIPESGRIVALADVFDALTTKRPYKQAWSLDSAITEIQRGSGTHFDPRLVEAFMANLDALIALKNKWEEQDSLTFEKEMLQR
ncbi:two-component system response regulator [Chitinibacter sp. GC72]|uniref:response regulator n=1 Tax=Chitinibacter sp. GC72 TaxID=1526917 RepID=UPI0012F9DE6A|nr:HD domain-containing phosphohydrolase [Chitinibacter sp. GC72]